MEMRLAETEELCASCGEPMEVGEQVVDTSAVEVLPFATAEWATVHARCSKFLELIEATDGIVDLIYDLYAGYGKPVGNVPVGFITLDDVQPVVRRLRMAVGLGPDKKRPENAPAPRS